MFRKNIEDVLSVASANVKEEYRRCIECDFC